MFLMLGIVALVAIVLLIAVVAAVAWRRVVETNMVHIVQYNKKTVSFGSGIGNGNVYYEWPSWIPKFGVKVIKLPVSNFDLSLQDYSAYDKDRVPFLVDVTAFFRIKDTNIAAQRVPDIRSLVEQLRQIVQGAVRKILASDNIDNIMLERSKFGSAFTDEVQDQLEQWGIEPVKNMELMDIRDASGSHVIENIMAKKKSHIEMESRIEVANNHQAAETAEIAATQTVQIRQQEAEELVGKRTAEKNKTVGIAEQQSQQEVVTQQAVTKEKEMEVVKVQTVRQAEINKAAAIVAAEQSKEVAVTTADGQLQATKLTAQGIQATGEAEGAAEQAKLLAPVEAQVRLAKEIGENENYQIYLVALKAIDGYVAVGTEQAKALEKSDVKIIANTGDAPSGITSAGQLFSPKGGQSIGAMLEALGNTPQGKALLDGISKMTKSDKAPPASNLNEAK